MKNLYVDRNVTRNSFQGLFVLIFILLPVISQAHTLINAGTYAYSRNGFSPTLGSTQISGSDAPLASVTLQPTCEVATGTITVTLPAPAEGITYSINGVDYSNTSGVFTNVVSGTYNVTVKNAAGYVSSPTSVTVNAALGKPAAPIADQWPDGECNLAVIRVTDPLPAEGITYSIDGVNYYNSEIFILRNIPSGTTYYVTVKNAAGCISDATPVTVTVYSSIPPVVEVTQPTCNVATGSITVTSPDPGPGLTFILWGNNLEYSNTTGIFTGIEPDTYEVRVSSGCLSYPSYVTINPSPETPAAPVASVTQQPTCETGTGTITVTSPSPGAGWIFQYSYNQQELVTNTTGVFTGLAPGLYYLSVVNPQGCTTYSTPLTVNSVAQAPAIPVLTVSQICGVLTGTITVVSPAPTTGISYSTDGVTFTNTTGVFGGLVPGNYNVYVRNAAGCVSAPRSATIVDATIALPAPVVRIVEQPQCDLLYGDIDVTSPSPDGLITYSIDGINYNSVTGAIGSLDPGTYNVTYKTAQGCISPATSVTIIDGPDTPAEGPVLAVTSQPSCESPTGTITVISPSPAPGQIYYINIGQEIASSTTGVFTGLMPGYYMIYYKTAGGCDSPNSSITVEGSTSGNPAQPGEFTESETYICAGTSTTFTVPLNESVIYMWNYTGTGAMITGSGNSVMVFFTETATSGILSIVAQNSCGSSPARELAITVRQLPGPAGTISGPSVVCQGAKNVVYSAAVIPNAVHYLWRVPEGATIIGGDDTNTITVDFSGTAVSGSITVQGSKVCGNGEVSPELFITVGHQIPNRPSAFMDSATYVCAVATARYQVRADPGVNYIWSYTGEGTVIETPFDSGTWLFFTENATSGTLSVVATSECGTSEARTIEITVRQLPGPAGMVSGPTEVCPGTRGVVYSVPVIPNAVHYLWNLPYGATIVGGYDTNTITVDFSEAAIPGVITVQGSKLCGTGAVSPELHIAGGNPPAQPGEFLDFTENICYGSSAVYSIQSQPGLTYNWSFSGTGATITANSPSLLIISFAEGATSGTLSVVAVNDCGTSIPRSRYITVRPLSGPAGTIAGPASVTSGSNGIVYTVPVIPNAVNYIWTLPAGATIVSGANTNSITVDFADDAYSGSITVQGSKSCGTGAVSPALQVIVTKPVTAKKALESGDIGIYPVPNKGAFNITFDTEGEKDVTIMVFNSSGIKVFEMKNVIISEKTELPFNISALPAGLYFMKFYDGMGEITKTVILSR